MQNQFFLHQYWKFMQYSLYETITLVVEKSTVEGRWIWT